ncbi:DUF262 domain-containing protein [Kineosporia mesophila]|uniref:DUF262 domain-containing protein n=1 Tax=Kineosporia mesophila TaxID=566012 RepID=A0ABP6ZY65_9ACTN
MSATGISVEKVFSGKSYGVGYFQRSYAWERPQVERLVQDLSAKFNAQWDPSHTEAKVRNYEPYFLGSVITYQEDGQRYLADGQQRMITLLLLLIGLHRLTEHREDGPDLNAELRTLIRGDTSMGRSFAVRVEDYERCFESLLNNQRFSVDGVSADVRRVWEASNEVLKACRDAIQEDALIYFGVWLLRRVSLVEIDAGGPERGQELYVLMNDRGVRLTALDLLKDYLLAGAPDDSGKLDRQWQGMVRALTAVDKNAPLDYVRTVLRSQYAHLVPVDESVRSIEDAPHEWLYRHRAILLGSRRASHTELFTQWLEPRYDSYTNLLRAATTLDEHLSTVWFNEYNGLSRQFDLVIAAVRIDDSPPTVLRKARLVANYIDLFVVTQGVMGRPYTQAELDEEVRDLMPAVRESHTIDGLSDVLGRAAVGKYAAFSSVAELQYKEGSNRSFVAYFLARLTGWMHREIGHDVDVQKYLERPDEGRPYEIEHLFTKRTDAYAAEGLSKNEIRQLRGKVGGLVLLPGSENASFGGDLLDNKIETYKLYNWLAASLAPSVYTGHGKVAFNKFLNKYGWKDRFHPYDPQVRLADLIRERGALYREMAEQAWSAAELGLKLPSVADPVPSPRQVGGKRVKLADLLRAGLVMPDERLTGERRRRQYRGTLLGDGRIRTETGGCFESPNHAAIDVRNVKSENGWTFWQVTESGETLDALRSRYRALQEGQRAG